jgi:hypothetical protein
MAAEVAAPAESQPFLRGSIIWQKKGGLPVWAWGGLVLLVALVFVWWRGRGDQTQAQADQAATGYDNLPGDQSAPPVFVVPQAPNPIITTPITVTVPAAPPGGGRDGPPQVPPGQPPPQPTPSPPGGYVSVTKYPDNTAPKEATLWDIAHSWLPAGAAQWKQIWTHPLNADLAKKRRAPERIQAGDKLFVPGKLQSFRR